MMRKTGLSEKRGSVKIYAVVALGLLVAVATFAAWRGGALWAINVDESLASIGKDAIVLDDDDRYAAAGSKANVLFMLDVGSSMTFTPIGKLPEIGKLGGTGVTPTAANFIARQRVAADLLEQCTYGDGSRPIQTGSSALSNGSRYGRDLDTSNNWRLGDTWADHQNDYYSPFADKPYLLVFKNTAYQSSLPTASSAYSTDNLVPNDSRMYKMKLVLWRLLSDESLFENLRIGMATTYQEMNTGGYRADYYKISPWGDATAPYTSVPFPHGSGPIWSTGMGGSNSSSAGSWNAHYGCYVGNAGAGYSNSQDCRWGIDRDYYDSTSHTVATWILVNRGYLRVPIGDYSDTVDDFRLWINGMENLATGSSNRYYHQDPELYADGKTFLSTAIFPGHPDLSRTKLGTYTGGYGSSGVSPRSGIVFSHRSSSLTVNIANSNNQNVLSGGSGEALGTVLDFFSPPVSGIGGVTFNGGNVSVAPTVSFPLKDPCEKNWLVLFTAGDDSSEYNTEHAVRDLYNHSKNNDLTMLSGTTGNSNSFSPIRLDDGIRTLVVGFVDPDSTETEVVELRNHLQAIARAGDPGNPDAQAFFANDVSGLIDAMRQVVSRINSEIRPAKRSMSESGKLEATDPDGNFNLFQTQYQIYADDQWRGMLTRFLVSMDRNGKTESTSKWELGTNLISRRPSRNLVFWNGTTRSFQTLAYTPSNTDTTPHPQASLFGLTNDNLPNYAASSGYLHPSRAMVNWLYGYDFSYALSGGASNKRVTREFMLSDFGNSGVVVVGPPDMTPSNLRGYNAWASSQSGRATRAYAQDNGGVLHVLNPTYNSGGGGTLETMAIVPPPALMSMRIAGLKNNITKEVVSGVTHRRASWLNAVGTFESDPTKSYSKAGFILDGPLVVKNFSDAQDNWRSYLYGMLGRGGNGLYAMNVTDPANPVFEWYRETAYTEGTSRKPIIITMSSGDVAPNVYIETHPQSAVGSSSSALVFNPSNGNFNPYPFYQLGYNSPEVVPGVARIGSDALGQPIYKNFLVLAGGLQDKLDLNNNGYMGAAIYILDPSRVHQTDTGSSSSGTMTFNGNASLFPNSGWLAGSSNVGPNPHMGMMLSPPYLVRTNDNRWLTGRIYAADNRGNIFEIELVTLGALGEEGTSLKPENWRIRTVASLRLSSEIQAQHNHCIPHGVIVAGTTQNYSSYNWVAGATANVGTQFSDSGLEEDSKIYNDGQYLFNIRVNNLKGAPSGSVVYRNHLKALGRDLTTDSLDPSDENLRGWYVKLNGALPGDGKREEYATVRPELLGNTFYFATFTPQESAITDCSGMVNGSSALFAIDAATGVASWGGSLTGTDAKNRSVTIEGIKITGFTHSTEGLTETLFVTYVVTDSALAEQSLDHWQSKGLLKRSGDLAAFTITRSTGRLEKLAPMSTYLNYWEQVE